METKGAKLDQLIIHHPRIPYKATPAVPVLSGDPICIIQLTGGFFRVLHINSGITLTDTNSLKAATHFISVVRRRYNSQPAFRDRLDAISWKKFCQHQNGKQDPDCNWLFLVLDRYSSLEGHVSKRVTINELYLHPPEPII